MLPLEPVITVAVTIVVFQMEGSHACSDKQHTTIYGDIRDLGLPKPKYSELLEQQRGFSAMTLESLRSTLCFNDNVRILDTLAGILIGLSRQPPNGALDYRLAVYFLDGLQDFAPEFVTAVKTVGMIINADRRLWAADMPVDYKALFLHATAFFYDPYEFEQVSERFFVIKKLIHEAMEGDVAAAKHIVNYLSAQNRDYSNLTSIDREMILEYVLERIDWYLRIGIKPILKQTKEFEAI